MPKNREDIINKLRISNVSIPKKEKDIMVEHKNEDIDEKLKSPICSILGHVDAGKTSLIRNICEIEKKETGGITQNIMAHFTSIEQLVKLTENIKGKFEVKPVIPGMLFIDTPGHQVFSSFRETGSSLCDVGIIVVDIIEGLKPQTIESINLLKKNKIPFVIAATKLDRIDSYVEDNNTSLRKTLKNQKKIFETLLLTSLEDLKYDLGKEDIKAEFYFKNKNPKSTYSIVPISNKFKNGLSDLISLIVFISQNWMNNKITYQENVDGTIMNNYLHPSEGWIVNIILKNGTITEGDKYYLVKSNEVVECKVRKLFDESDDKSYKSIRASKSIRVIGSNMDNILVGTKLFNNRNEANKCISNLNSYEMDKSGVFLQAPTYGCIDGLYKIFKENNIPIINVKIGKLSEKNTNILLSQIGNIKDLEYRCLIYYDNIIGKDRTLFDKLAKDNNFKIIDSDHIYTLVDDYKKYQDECLKNRQKEQEVSGQAIYPCKLKILKEHIYMTGGGGDLLMGIKVLQGKIKKGMPLYLNLCDYKKNKQRTTETWKSYNMGKIMSIQKNNEEKEEAVINDEVCIRLDNPYYLTFGRNFDEKDSIISQLTRESIDLLKKDYRDELKKEDWLLVLESMKILDIKKSNN